MHKGKPFQQIVLEQLNIYMQKRKKYISDSHFISPKTNNSNQIIDLNVKSKLIKQLNENFVTSGKDSLDTPKA